MRKTYVIGVLLILLSSTGIAFERNQTWINHFQEDFSLCEDNQSVEIITYAGDSMECEIEGFVKNVWVGSALSMVDNEKQLAFANEHYDFINIADPSISANSLDAPIVSVYQNLLQYNLRVGYDPEHVYSNENMFAHNSSSPYENHRIRSSDDSAWLMDRRDLVNDSDPNARNHWVNYLTEVTLNWINAYETLDGVFIDMANNKINPNNFEFLPDNFSQDEWTQATQDAIRYIKAKLQDKKVFFNGVGFKDNEELSLEFADGGLWETWAFRGEQGGRYVGENEWKRTLDLVERNKHDKMMALSAKKPGLTSDIKSRVFLLSSYLLMTNGNVILSMVDYDINPGGSMMWYPEYEIDLGNALGDYTVDNGLYRREFEKGFILVNPSEENSYSYILNGTYYKMIPIGGGYYSGDGSWEGHLEWEAVNGTIMLPPISGAVLLNEDELQFAVDIKKPQQGYLYIFNHPVMPIKKTVIIGKISIQTEISGAKDIDQVEFYIDDVLKNTDTEEPYSWIWSEKAMGWHEIKVVAYDSSDSTAEDAMSVFIFNI